jgi:hypothetical protein
MDVGNQVTKVDVKSATKDLQVVSNLCSDLGSIIM